MMGAAAPTPACGIAKSRPAPAIASRMRDRFTPVERLGGARRQAATSAVGKSPLLHVAALHAVAVGGVGGRVVDQAVRILAGDFNLSLPGVVVELVKLGMLADPAEDGRDSGRIGGAADSGEGLRGRSDSPSMRSAKPGS